MSAGSLSRLVEEKTKPRGDSYVYSIIRRFEELRLSNCTYIEEYEAKLKSVRSVLRRIILDLSFRTDIYPSSFSSAWAMTTTSLCYILCVKTPSPAL